MRKVKLVFVKSFLEVPSFKDTFATDISVDVPDGFDNFHLIGARTAAAPGKPGELLHGDINSLILTYDDVSNLVGHLLTYIDATFTDTEQRKAHKDIVKEKVHGWHDRLRERAVQTVDSHTPQGDGDLKN